MPDQDLTLDEDLEVDGSELADAVGGPLVANTAFIKALAADPTFATEFMKNPIVMAQLNKQAGAAAGTAVTNGLTR